MFLEYTEIHICTKLHLININQIYLAVTFVSRKFVTSILNYFDAFRP